MPDDITNEPQGTDPKINITTKDTEDNNSFEMTEEDLENLGEYIAHNESLEVNGTDASISNSTPKNKVENTLFDKFIEAQFDEFSNMTDSELSEKQDYLISKEIKETNRNLKPTNAEKAANTKHKKNYRLKKKGLPYEEFIDKEKELLQSYRKKLSVRIKANREKNTELKHKNRERAFKIMTNPVKYTQQKHKKKTNSQKNTELKHENREKDKERRFKIMANPLKANHIIDTQQNEKRKELVKTKEVENNLMIYSHQSFSALAGEPTNSEKANLKRKPKDVSNENKPKKKKNNGISKG